jgi:hypothetical protein
MFYVHVTVHRNKILFNKTNTCTNFPNLFWLKNEPLRVSGSFSSHHQEFSHCTLGTGISHTSLLTGWNIPALLESCLQIYMTYTSVKCTVNELLMMSRGTAGNTQRFTLSQNKFGNLVQISVLLKINGCSFVLFVCVVLVSDSATD